MLRSLKQLYGKRLRASDGDIGRVKDFYFNDQQWVVRYVIAETGSWLLGRLVIDRISYEEDAVFVNVTKEAILEGPESHAPPLDPT